MGGLGQNEDIGTGNPEDIPEGIETCVDFEEGNMIE